jgi:signal transduction histidine kinase
VRRRILQSTLLAVAITALVLGGPLALTTWQLVEDFDRARLVASLEQVAARLDDAGTPVDVAGLELAVPAGGRLVVAVEGRPPLVIGVDTGADPVAESLPFRPGGVITLEEPRAVLTGQQVQVTLAVLLLVVLSVTVGAVVATLTARRLAVPLLAVADRAARLGAGDFRAAPARHGIPELDRVSDVLDTSATALAQLVQRERTLVGDVSHQLRSRLTALQLRLDELSTHPDPTARSEALAALDQAERLTAVLDELLADARAARAAGAEPLDLGAALSEIAEEWRPVLRDAGRSLKVRLPTGVLARVTPARLREAVGVLLDNACATAAAPWRSPRGPPTRVWSSRSATTGPASRPNSCRTSSSAACRRGRPPASGSPWPAPWWRRTAAGWSSPGRGRRRSRSSSRPPAPTTSWPARPAPLAPLSGPAIGVRAWRAPAAERSRPGRRTGGTPTSGRPCPAARRRSGRTRSRPTPA